MESDVMLQEIKDKFEDYLIARRFKPRYIEVAHLRLSLYDNCDTLESIGKRYGISKERVRQIESKLEVMLKIFLKTNKIDRDLILT